MTSQHEVLPVVYLNISSGRYRYSGTIDPEKERKRENVSQRSTRKAHAHIVQYLYIIYCCWKSSYQGEVVIQLFG